MVLFSTVDGRTENLELATSTTIVEVKSFVEALLGIAMDYQIFVLDGKRVNMQAVSLEQAGIKKDSLVVVMDSSSAQPGASSAMSNPSPMPMSAPSATSATTVATNNSTTITRRSNNLLGNTNNQKIYWDGMNLDQVFDNNTNPEYIVDIILDNPNTILRELNFHIPKLAESFNKGRSEALKAMRVHLMMNATSSTLNRLNAATRERDMEARLRTNPMDEEANKYFGDKIRQEQVQESYINMMQNFPESNIPVLMLYVDVKINGVIIQAFVDSGAQTSVMSYACAEKCNIDRLIDQRFAGKLVGVGTGTTKGRIHLVDIKIENNFFPMSVTVTDDKQGLGDKNMEFLLGLDMLKRHRANIDLTNGKLVFLTPSGTASTPFLHEKDLPSSKGGTKGFDVDLANAQNMMDQNQD